AIGLDSGKRGQVRALFVSRLRDSNTIDDSRWEAAMAVAALEGEEDRSIPLAAEVLQLSMTKAEPETVLSSTRGLMALATRMKPKDGAIMLVQAMSMTTNPLALQSLATDLPSVAARLEPKEAARACGEAAARLRQAMTETSDPSALRYL